MGRGLHLNKMSDAELKEAKKERDAKRYEAQRYDRQKAYQIAKRDAETITCGCGGTYKNIPQLKSSHLRVARHQLWCEEEELQVRQLICRKVKDVNTLEEAQAKLDECYFNADKYSYIQKECYLPKIMNRLSKIADKPIDPLAPPPPPKKKLKLVIKKKINVNNE